MAKGHILTKTNDIKREAEKTEAQKIQDELKDIYENHILSLDQSQEINKMRIEYSEKSRALLLEYMKKEYEVATRYIKANENNKDDKKDLV